MEAESRKVERKKTDVRKKITEKMQPIETLFRSLKSKTNFRGQEMTGISSSSGSILSFKRKVMSTIPSVEPSPGKKRKLNFTDNLSFWKTTESPNSLIFYNNI